MSWVVISTFLVVVMVPSPVIGARNCSFPAIFNFGDSNSDTGGLSAAFGQAPPPNGITFFHTPVGRFSDGRLIIDFLGKWWKFSLIMFFVSFWISVSYLLNIMIVYTLQTNKDIWI